LWTQAQAAEALVRDGADAGSALAVEILIGALMDAGVFPLFAVVAAGTIGGSQFRKKRVRPRGAKVET
jgi:hypothetical protein